MRPGFCPRARREIRTGIESRNYFGCNPSREPFIFSTIEPRIGRHLSRPARSTNLASSIARTQPNFSPGSNSPGRIVERPSEHPTLVGVFPGITFSLFSPTVARERVSPREWRSFAHPSSPLGRSPSRFAARSASGRPTRLLIEHEWKSFSFLSFLTGEGESAPSLPVGRVPKDRTRRQAHRDPRRP